MLTSQPLSLYSFPRAIVHIDGDAFFASCEQARNPSYKGKPLITGKERGIASSLSYEAKAMGVKRGMRLSEIKKLCPQIIILPSDYETYCLLSKRLFEIVRRYTNEVEEYSIDECFADLTGLRRPLRMNYTMMAERIQKDLAIELGFTFSVGLGPNKIIAKIGSKWKKPAGLTVIPAREIHLYLEKLPVEKVWGIGPQTTAYLNKNKVFTALDYARKNEEWIKKRLTRPFLEIWKELNGHFVLPLETKEKEDYASIQKVKTFTPPSRDPVYVFSQLSKNVENACMKARRYKLEAMRLYFFLKTQDFNYRGAEIKLSRSSAFPNEIIRIIRPLFHEVFDPALEYRATGVCLFKLKPQSSLQLDLFGEVLAVEKFRKIFESVDVIRNKYGKHTVCLGSSLLANKSSQHLNERGDLSERSKFLLPGETKRKRLGIPMFLGEVI
ncbi:MAG TPA: DNA polymerase IV [Syntrophorhabdus sp.]|jgi:DNA polymerase-4/DNA polymerase V|nr:DNA polymerase IV [Syntrophorhabdus sp.]MDI9557803.1 DNA polymerase IV [Pseudomonadota bacterium]OPX92659.1 MAG: DNA polymerase IV [Syntrophorhabdus sp. PtaB.Bin027]OQB76317.1 MAG: DNA polymerase IV [Deltaproteobacteria bacterium ADurb.Bin135]MBP8744915.1 DNA polymerase IV [Syntrophorhabdus sp.]